MTSRVFLLSLVLLCAGEGHGRTFPGWSVRGAADMDGNGKPDLVWQDDSTRQVAVWYMGGPQGDQFQSFGWIDVNGVPGWTVVAIADLDGNGKPDVIWMNDSTHQVAVWYMGGVQGNTFQSFGWIDSNGVPGWTVVAMADLDGNGKPDVIWVNDSTRQVAVWYMGGAQGNIFQSFGWIDSNGVPGWTMVAMADLDRNGKPDVIWVNDSTRQVAVWYMGGAQGNTFQSFAWIDPNGIAGWWITAVADLNGDGHPDLLWRQDATAYVAAWYMGGVQGNTFQSFAWINQNPTPIIGAPDFMLSALPGQTVSAGGSIAMTENVTAVGGFNSTVTFDYTSWPEGLTANFGPNPIVPSGSTTITIVAAPGVSGGTYNLPFDASGGGVSHSGTISVTVPPAGFADYKLGAPPSLVTAVAGGAAISFRQNVFSLSGYSAPVTLGFLPLPPGISFTINPNPVRPDSYTTITLAATAGTAPGTYTLRLSGDGGGAHTVTVNLRVTTCPTPYCGCVVQEYVLDKTVYGNAYTTLSSWNSDADPLVAPYFNTQTTAAKLFVPLGNGFGGPSGVNGNVATGSFKSTVRFPTANPADYFRLEERGFGMYTATFNSSSWNSNPQSGCAPINGSFSGSLAIPPPIINSMSQSSAEPGQTLTNVIIRGTSLVQGGIPGVTAISILAGRSLAPGFTASIMQVVPGPPEDYAVAAIGIGPDVVAGTYYVALTAWGTLTNLLPLNVTRTLEVTVSGTPVSRNACVYITLEPLMPQLTARLKGGSAADSVAWWLRVQYTGPDSPPTTDSTYFPQGLLRELLGNATWYISQDWAGLFRGGDATLSWVYNAEPEQQFPFCIRGTNPSVFDAKSRLDTFGIWFLKQIAKHESSYPDPEGYKQFFSDGRPLWTNGHGFGMMQVDPPRNVEDIWKWTQNIQSGVSVLLEKRNESDAFWTRQKQQWTDWNNDPVHADALVPPPDDTSEGNCVFSFQAEPPDQQNPQNPHSYRDGIWIKRYNSASGGNYIAFDNVNGAWSFNPMNDAGFNYVNRICTTIP